jgi:hypothetical protein
MFQMIEFGEISLKSSDTVVGGRRTGGVGGVVFDTFVARVAWVTVFGCVTGRARV